VKLNEKILKSLIKDTILEEQAIKSALNRVNKAYAGTYDVTGAPMSAVGRLQKRNRPSEGRHSVRKEVFKDFIDLKTGDINKNKVRELKQTLSAKYPDWIYDDLSKILSGGRSIDGPYGARIKQWLGDRSSITHPALGGKWENLRDDINKAQHIYDVVARLSKDIEVVNKWKKKTGSMAAAEASIEAAASGAPGIAPLEADAIYGYAPADPETGQERMANLKTRKYVDIQNLPPELRKKWNYNNLDRLNLDKLLELGKKYLDYTPDRIGELKKLANKSGPMSINTKARVIRDLLARPQQGDKDY
jgi:hypothetical protein